MRPLCSHVLTVFLGVAPCSDYLTQSADRSSRSAHQPLVSSSAFRVFTLVLSASCSFTFVDHLAICQPAYNLAAIPASHTHSSLARRIHPASPSAFGPHSPIIILFLIAINLTALSLGFIHCTRCCKKTTCRNLLELLHPRWYLVMSQENQYANKGITKTEKSHLTQHF